MSLKVIGVFLHDAMPGGLGPSSISQKWALNTKEVRFFIWHNSKSQSRHDITDSFGSSPLSFKFQHTFYHHPRYDPCVEQSSKFLWLSQLLFWFQSKGSSSSKLIADCKHLAEVVWLDRLWALLISDWCELWRCRSIYACMQSNQP